MSDNSSLCSSHSATSVTNSKMECPHCNKDLQVRAMFAHIRKFHNDELLSSTSRKYIEEAEAGYALRVYWIKKNDFDEDETTILYVCLSTNKTFTTAERAKDHFKKDKAALKDHNKQLKDLKKQHAAFRKVKAKTQAKNSKEDPSTLRFIAARASNNPDLARALWRGILNNRTTLETCKMITRRAGYESCTSMYLFNSKTNDFDEMPYSEFMTHYSDIIKEIEQCLSSHCLDVKPLLDLYFTTEHFWRMNFAHSILGLHGDLRALHPLYNTNWNGGDEKFYGFATEEMRGVDF